MSKSRLRCLIGSLYSGENELEASEAALSRQDFRNWERIRIDNLAEYEAHRRLYSVFMARRSEFDLFIKIDPDMVLADTASLGRIVRFMQRRSGVDHVCFAVHDYMSDNLIMGLHAYTSRVEWQGMSHLYHPDFDPRIRGARMRVYGAGPVASHASDPSPYQAFHFGAHRMLKALGAQTPALAAFQWDTLDRVRRHAERNNDCRLRLVLLGAWHVWNGDLNERATDVADEKKNQLFMQYHCADASDLDRAIPEKWRHSLARNHLPYRLMNRLVSRADQAKERWRAWWMLK